MTNEKLVEKVAEIISAGFVTGEEMQPITETARAVTKIVGEACARSVHSIAHSTISERELLDAIKSLTQGKET